MTVTLLKGSEQLSVVFRATVPGVRSADQGLTGEPRFLAEKQHPARSEHPPQFGTRDSDAVRRNVL